MPLQFRLKKGLRLFGGKLGIVDREKGEKIRAESSLSGFPASKTIELREDILGGGVLDPSEQLPSRGDSVCEYLQLLVAVIRPQELVIDVSETSQGPPPDPDHEVEHAVLKAASEGRWEEINQVFNRPSQQERVLLAQNKFGWSPLHFAVYYGHLNIVNQLVNVCRLPPEQKTKEGRTPLMVSSGAGHLPVAKLLLETHRSNVNEEDSESATAVLYAARRGHLPVVKVLLEHGADVLHKAEDSVTALHLAAYGGSIECLEYLLPLFGDCAFTVDEDGSTCLHYAVAGGSVPVVRYLVDQCGFDLGLRTAAGLTPLMFAAVYGHLAMAKLLVETYRCDVNEEDSKSWTPVMYAAELGHLPVLKMLIEHGADVFHKAEGSATALHFAASGGSVECVEYLLPLFGDRRFEVDENGLTCLHHAVWGGSVPVMRYLMDQCGFDPGLRNATGLTPLMLAAAFGHLAVAKLLVETYRCDVNEESSKSKTPVMFAAWNDHLPVLKMLIEHGANVLHKAEDSATALHFAALGGSIECLEYLLPLFGDRRFEMDAYGRTCLHCAVGGGSIPVMRYLVDQCGFDLGLRTAVGETPLILAAVRGRLAVAKLLVETYRCDVNEGDSESKTPVMYAARNDHLPVLKMLMEHGANVLQKAEESVTALHLAAYGGSIECLEYLLPLFGDRRFEMDEDGQTCLHYAVLGGSVPVMRYLVDQCGFDLGLRTAGGLDCFLLACKEGHQKNVRELLTRDEVDRNVVDEDGRDALDWASKGGHTELVEMLLDEYGFPDTRDTGQSTPLDLAPDFAQDDIVEAALQSHESTLEHVCWISSGIESLFVTLFGGDFPLVPVGEEEDAKEVIHLHVPPGSVRADGEGVVEVHYGVLPDGPFQIPEGYRLCSTTVYINYSQAQTTKPFLLSLPHWSGGLDHPVFVTSPHTLPEGEQYYPFRLLEGGEFGEGYGIVEVDGHCSLFALAYRLEDTSRYYASLWEREEGNILHSKVAVTFESNVWMRILKNHWPGWKKRFTESFEMKEDHIESCLTEDSGRGWHAACVGKNWVGPGDIEYVKKYKSDENELQYAVEDHLYPPAICHDVRQSELPRHLQSYKCIYLHIHGAKEGVITFSIDVLEEKEVPSVVATHLCLESGASERPVSLTKQVSTTGASSVVATHLCLESGSTARPVSLTQQVPTTGGDMEVTQSRSEAAVSDRYLLSQPVHCCKRYAVLFRKHVSRQGAGKGTAILEFLGLTPELIDLCYQNNPRNEEEAIQVGLKKWQTQGDNCTWQDLLEAMTFAGISEQHCSQLVQELHQWLQSNT